MADGLQPFVVQGLFSRSGRSDLRSIPDVLDTTHAAYDLDFDAATPSTLITFRDSDLIVEAVAADASRFSSASFQTISITAMECLKRDALAWEMIKLYYSAFYAGHALIRLLGEGCSYFDKSHVTRIKGIADALGKPLPFQIESGIYRAIIERSSTQIRCIKLRGASGGTHELFWDVFGKRIRAASEEVLSGPLAPRDAQLVFAQLAALDAIIRRQGSHNWLSVVRNTLQYRHGYGVWFPSELKKGARHSLSRLVGKWNSDPMSIHLNAPGATGNGDLGDFAIACAFIVATCHALLLRIAERSAAGKRSFIHSGPMAFLNDARLRAA
ncbi:MAG: hypothetical protein MN733_36805 [Nitrososphaera sp.]|nr:hypothetical protein [Nitrososphaera sp.]